MDKNLIAAIKKELEYSEEVRRCDKCTHHTERDDKFCDRMWVDECNYSNLGPFRVAKHGFCKMFEKKQ